MWVKTDSGERGRYSGEQNSQVRRARLGLGVKQETFQPGPRCGLMGELHAATPASRAQNT